MINPADLLPNVNPKVRENVQRRWDKKQERTKKAELHELHLLMTKAESRLMMSPYQRNRLLVLFDKYKNEESPA